MSDAKPEEQAATATAGIKVLRGGTPTPQELAAIVVALSPVDDGEAAAGNSRRSAWAEASLLEGVGFRPFVSVDDVERYHRSIA